MGFFDKTPKETTKVCLEVFKGKLEKAAIVDSSKKEFAENENLKESVFIVEGASEKVMTMAKGKLNFDVNISDDFKLSYLIFFTNENKIHKLIAIITEGLEDELAKLLEDNKFILRIQK